MAEKIDSHLPSESVSQLTSDPPPPYSGVSSYGWAVNVEPEKNRQPLEDQVVLTLHEVDTGIARYKVVSHAHEWTVTSEVALSIKEKAELLLRRNVQEQRVLPTASQREITLAHVIASFHYSAPTVRPSSNVSGQTAQQSSVISIPPAEVERNHRRKVVGTWFSYSVCGRPKKKILAYTGQVPGAVACMAVYLVVCFFLGTPLSLFATIPTLYWIRKAKKQIATGEMVKAKENFKVYVCMSICIFFVFGGILVAVIATPLALTVGAGRA